MDFVKQNLISVIAVVLAVIGIPVMVFFSSGWNADIKADLESGVSSAMQTVQNTRVNYQMPAPEAGAQPWELRTEPSQLRNNTMQERLERLVERSTRSQEAIERINKEGKELLVATDERYGDLFPAPQSESARVALLTRMMAVYPDAHESLLEDAGIRGPLPAGRVQGQLEAQQTREMSSITASRVEQELTEEEMDQVRERLGAFRRELYAQHASDTVFFGGPEIFTGVPRLDPEEGDEIITLERAWEWQHRTWVHQDLIAALLEANGGDNARTGPVKRVVEISVDPWPIEPSSVQAAQPQSGLSAPIALDYTEAHTGLRGWQGRPNPLYDLRNATVRVIVDGDRIHEVVDAIGNTNLMFVTDMDIREYDGDIDLRRGYDYGGGQTAALTLRVQTAWLRSWIKTDMPASVRTMLGIPEDPAPLDDQTADAS